MDEGARAAGSPVDPAAHEGTRSPEEIRAEIEETRAEVGDTVEALARKTDVKAQAKQRIQEIQANVRQRGKYLKTRAQSTTPQSAQKGAGQVVARVRENPAPSALGGAVLLAFLIGRRTARRRDEYR